EGEERKVQRRGPRVGGHAPAQPERRRRFFLEGLDFTPLGQVARTEHAVDGREVVRFDGGPRVRDHATSAVNISTPMTVVRGVIPSLRFLWRAFRRRLSVEDQVGAFVRSEDLAISSEEKLCRLTGLLTSHTCP